jgi:hypothetical protein
MNNILCPLWWTLNIGGKRKKKKTELSYLQKILIVDGENIYYL